MAVLATYEDAEWVAVYHYARSIMSRQPFTGGVENLALLFKKNAQTYAKLREAKADADQQLSLRMFLTNFVRIHGLLFWWSASMHREYANLLPSAASTQGSGAWVPPANLASPDEDDADARSAPDLEKAQALLRDVVEAFEQQLQTANFTDVLLVRLLALCFFSVHFAVGKERNVLVSSVRDTQSPSPELQQVDGPQTKTECIALQFLYSMIIRYSSTLHYAVRFQIVLID